MPLTYAKPERISLKSHPELNEKWVQNHLADDPSLLGLGELTLRDRERPQPRAGRLDLLFEDSEANHRYEVEIQLGQTDESHIIRTLEYWDIERKRYPQYDHTAVIVAEDITSRFLNVIGLFNGTIPLMAIQMQAFRLGEQVSLLFTTVLDEMRLGLMDTEGEPPATDRGYWETRANRATLTIADELLAVIRTWDPKLELKYNKAYIGLAKDGQPDNFVVFRPKRGFLRLELRLPRSDEIQAKLDAEGMDVMDYDTRWGYYRIRLSKDDIKGHNELVRALLKLAYDQGHGE